MGVVVLHLHTGLLAFSSHFKTVPNSSIQHAEFVDMCTMLQHNNGSHIDIRERESTRERERDSLAPCCQGFSRFIHHRTAAVSR